MFAPERVEDEEIGKVRVRQACGHVLRRKFCNRTLMRVARAAYIRIVAKREVRGSATDDTTSAANFLKNNYYMEM